MKKIIISIFITLFFIILFLFGLYGFSKNVQQYVKDDIVKYESLYTEIKLTDSKEEIVKKARHNIGYVSYVLSIGKADNSEYEYKLALYDLMGYLNLCDDECNDTGKIILNVNEKHKVWMGDLEYFLENKLYAMLHTI